MEGFAFDRMNRIYGILFSRQVEGVPIHRGCSFVMTRRNSCFLSVFSVFSVTSVANRTCDVDPEAEK